MVGACRERVHVHAIARPRRGHRRWHVAGRQPPGRRLPRRRGRPALPVRRRQRSHLGVGHRPLIAPPSRRPSGKSVRMAGGFEERLGGSLRRAPYVWLVATILLYLLTISPLATI